MKDVLSSSTFWSYPREASGGRGINRPDPAAKLASLLRQRGQTPGADIAAVALFTCDTFPGRYRLKVDMMPLSQGLQDVCKRFRDRVEAETPQSNMAVQYSIGWEVRMWSASTSARVAEYVALLRM